MRKFHTFELALLLALAAALLWEPGPSTGRTTCRPK